MPFTHGDLVSMSDTPTLTRVWNFIVQVLLLPVPVQMDRRVSPRSDMLDQAAAGLTASLVRNLSEATRQSSCLPILRARPHPAPPGPATHLGCCHMASLPQHTADTPPRSTRTFPPLGAPTSSRSPMARSIKCPPPMEYMRDLQTTGVRQR